MNRNVVVIGAGLAGTLICNELAPTRSVALLEAGRKDRIGYPPIEFTGKPLAAVKTVCTGGGGTTNLWHNGLIPIHAEDITSNDFHAVLADAQRYMDKAARKLYWPGHLYTAEYECVVAEMSAIADAVGVFSDGIDCLLYPKRYRRLEADKGVDASYSVSDIDFVSNGNSIRSITFKADGSMRTVKADTVVITAGALNSPQLVKKALAALGRSSERVGEGFMDHPIGFVGKVRFKKHVHELIKKLNLCDKRDYECRTAVRLKSRSGRYTCAAFFRPAITMKNNPAIYKYKSLLGASSGMERIKNLFSPRVLHPDILAEIAAHLFSVPIPGRTYNIFLVFEQKRGESTVSRNKDGLVVDWRITQEELSIYRDVLKKLRCMLEGVAEEINLKMDIDGDWLWSHAHHSGTVSLGNNSGSCVDRDLKLHGCDNVFVCDGSVVQEHSYANTGLTIGQLAMRLAERIAQ